MKKLALLSLAAAALALPTVVRADDMKAPAAAAPAAAPAAAAPAAASTDYWTADKKTKVTVKGSTASVDGKALTKGEWKLDGGKTLTVDDKGAATVK